MATLSARCPNIPQNIPTRIPRRTLLTDNLHVPSSCKQTLSQPKENIPSRRRRRRAMWKLRSNLMELTQIQSRPCGSANPLPGQVIAGSKKALSVYFGPIFLFEVKWNKVTWKQETMAIFLVKLSKLFNQTLLRPSIHNWWVPLNI